jgi:hypothetical protein
MEETFKCDQCEKMAIYFTRDFFERENHEQKTLEYEMDKHVKHGCADHPPQSVCLGRIR